MLDEELIDGVEEIFGIKFKAMPGLPEGKLFWFMPKGSTMPPRIQIRVDATFYGANGNIVDAVHMKHPWTGEPMIHLRSKIE